MLKQHAIPSSGLPNLKIYSSRGCRKASQRWSMYVANKAILKLRVFRGRYHFRLWVLASTGEYFYYWHWGLLPKVLQSKWSQYNFTVLPLTNHMYIADWLIWLGPLKSWWFSAVCYRIWLEGCQTRCVRSFSFAKSQQAFNIKPANYTVKIIIQDVNKKTICWYGTQ